MSVIRERESRGGRAPKSIQEAKVSSNPFCPQNYPFIPPVPVHTGSLQPQTALGQIGIPPSLAGILSEIFPFLSYSMLDSNYHKITEDKKFIFKISLRIESDCYLGYFILNLISPRCICYLSFFQDWLSVDIWDYFRDVCIL